MDKEVLRQWANGLRMYQIAHQRAAARYGRSHILIGVPATALAAMIGTSLFVDEPTALLKAIAAVASVAVAILTALQTFFNFPQLATAHSAAAARFGGLRRRLEAATAFTADDAAVAAAAQQIRTDWDALEETMPIVPQRFVDDAMRRIRPAGAGGPAALPPAAEAEPTISPSAK